LSPSARLLRQAAENYRRQGQLSRLAGLVRSVAYEELLQGNHGAAGKLLAEAGELLRSHGAPPIEGWAPVASGAGRSSAPFGFDALDETHAALALRELIFRGKKAWPEILSLLEQRIANRQKALAAREDEELGRELLLLKNRLAMARLRLGQQAGFLSLLEEVMEATRKLQVDPKEGYRPDAFLFPLETAFSLSVAEQVLGQAARGEAEAGALQTALERLQGLELQRTRVLDKDKTELLPPRLRLSLWNALALLSFHRGLLGAAPAGADKGRKEEKERNEKEDKSKAADRRSTAAQALERVVALGQPLVTAQRLLRAVMKETAPGAPPEEDRAEKEAAALERGVLAPLWRPLSPGERLRWHLLAGLNLAEVSASLSPASALEKHPSTELLTALAAPALADAYPVSGKWGVSPKSSKDPIDCAGLRVIAFNGDTRTDSHGGVPAYRNRSVRGGSGGRWQIVDVFTTGQISNGTVGYTLIKTDENHIALDLDKGGAIKLIRCK
jgi:hypothetical protein